MKIPAFGASATVQPLSPTRPSASEAVAPSSRVDTTDTVQISSEARSLSKGDERFVTRVRSIVERSNAARDADLARAAALRDRAQATGDAPGQAMNAKTGDQSSTARYAPGQGVSRLVRR
jgi:hypothetical protein